ncbi:MAG: hypothetical protein KA765_15030 [Thermoflexales bacterium]|nr:hypothetical protein [Thermoflexales bacterium]
MSDFLEKIGLSIIKTQEQSMDLLEKLIATARPNAVFGHPVTGGDYTVISASEVSCGMGLGFGGGGGDNGATKSEPVAEEITIEGETPDPKAAAANGYGVGGGGGGFSTARPVAAISIGPDGVHVEPVVDVTKIGLAFFTTLGAMALMLSKMQQASK